MVLEHLSAKIMPISPYCMESRGRKRKLSEGTCQFPRIPSVNREEKQMIRKQSFVCYVVLNGFHLLNNYYMPGTMLSAGAKFTAQTEHSLPTEVVAFNP